MANFFEELFGLGDTTGKAESMIKDSYAKQKDLISGSADASLREQQAESDIQAARGGYKGSPVETVVRAALREGIEKNKQAGLAKTQAQESQAMAGLEMQKIADKRAQQANNIALFSNIFKGLGDIAGYLLPLPV